eukprot:188056-Lingulodinium_polyedra.AAC.1
MDVARGLAHNVHNTIPNIVNCSARIGRSLSSHPECVLVRRERKSGLRLKIGCAWHHKHLLAVSKFA